MSERSVSLHPHAQEATLRESMFLQIDRQLIDLMLYTNVKYRSSLGSANRKRVVLDPVMSLIMLLIVFIIKYHLSLSRTVSRTRPALLLNPLKHEFDFILLFLLLLLVVVSL
ncbi:hypothetical protein FGO68_gene2904 [Halteria grandinella]|uniref:Uncharacterized protein n=1 Tax=Halteria grandinella TaxID=5974 RepID=A0A8J8STJ9_HALGN|nr:hypothetical protein FGO68_gene2904 [Halteria grandinella]